MSKNDKDRPIALLIIRDARELPPKTLKRITAWLREQAQIIDLQSNELSNIYSAKYWRTK